MAELKDFNTLEEARLYSEVVYVDDAYGVIQ